MDQGRREGFWYSDREPHLPMPEPSPVPWEGQAAFLAALAARETVARSVTFRGFSLCRVCRRANGSQEFTLAGWCWPSGLAHYVRDHNVRPTEAFIEFIISLGGD